MNTGLIKTYMKPNRIYLMLVIGALIALPQLIKNNYLISTIANCFVFAALGVAWNIIGGYGSQISWCHAAFVTIGAYTNFILYKQFGISPFITMPIGMVISYAMATVIGNATFRLRGFFFSIATIAFAEIIRICLLFFDTYTNGSAGLFVTFSGNSIWNLMFENDTPFYYILMVILSIVMILTRIFEKSKTGYFLGAIKGDEDAAQALGIETFKVKMHAFQLSAVITSAVGAVYASYLTYLDPASICGMDLSVKIGVVAIIGGLGTLWGPVLGAFLIVPLIEITGMLLGQKGGSQLLYGLILVLIVLFRPSGLITLFNQKRMDMLHRTMLQRKGV